MCTYHDVRYRELSPDHTVLWIYNVDENGNPASLVERIDHSEDQSLLGDLIGRLADGYVTDIPPLRCSGCGLEADHWGPILDHLE